MWSYYSTRSATPLTTASTSSGATNGYSNSFFVGHPGLSGATADSSSSKEFYGGVNSFMQVTESVTGTASGDWVSEFESFSYANQSVGTTAFNYTTGFVNSSSSWSIQDTFGDPGYSGSACTQHSYSYSVSGNSSTYYDFFSVTEGIFALTSYSSSTRSTATFVNTQVTSYNSTTTTSTSTGSLNVTTTSTRNSTVLTTASTSTTGTTTSARTTASTITADPFTTFVSTNSTQTFTTYSSTSFSGLLYLDLIIETESSDWCWEITTTGTSNVSDIASTFGATTFTIQGLTTSFSYHIYALSDVTSSYSWTRPTTGSSSTTSTISTTSSSSYAIGLAASTVVPFTNTVSASIGYLSSRTTSYSYATSTTSTSSIGLFSSTFSVLSSSTVRTTFSGGTSQETLTWTAKTQDSNRFTTGTFSTTSASVTQTASSTCGGNLNSWVVPWMPSGSTISPANISVREITIGRGFQSPASIGRLQPIGTNLSAGAQSSVSSIGLGWPRTDNAPVVTASGDIGLDGTVPITLLNSRTSTKFGGFGWDSSASTLISATKGIHRMTTANSTTSSAFETTWDVTNSSYSLGSGKALVAETVPLVNSVLTTYYAPFVNFFAYPST